MHTTAEHLPDVEMENKAVAWRRLGKLLKYADNEEEALKSFMAAVTVYRDLFDNDRDSYEIALADVLFECGSLHMKKSLEQARRFLEEALLLLGTRYNKPADTYTQKLQYLTLTALASLHQQQGNHEQTAAYQKMALFLGAAISLNKPEGDLLFLLEAVRRFRTLLGEKEEGPHSAAIYNYALYHFTRIEKWQSQDDSYNNAKALIKLGLRLLVEQEATGADICFRGALKIFRILNKKGYSCLGDIASSLELVGFIHMTRNRVKAQKKVLLEALNIYKELAETGPPENLLQAASVLNTLYYSSFVGVAPSQFHKATPFFEEALEIHKRLADNDQPHFGNWLQLLQHRSIFFSRGLDKTDIITWYQELIYLRSLIPSLKLSLYEEDIQVAIYEVRVLLLKETKADHPLFLQIAADVINAHKNLFKKKPKKYKIGLLWAYWEAGNKLADASQWQSACPYLKKAVELIRELNQKEPGKYDKSFQMPALKLAIGYSELKEYAHSADCFTDLCNYFESELPEHPEYREILVSLKLSLTEALLSDGQKDKAGNCIKKAMAYLAKMDDSPEQLRLKSTFNELINEHFS